MTDIDPMCSAARSQRMKDKYKNDPDYYRKICERNKARAQDPIECQLRSERMKAVWKRPDIREKIIKNMAGGTG